MALISDVLNLPRTVNRGDFVLRLSEGITDAHAEATLHDYVVTPRRGRLAGVDRRHAGLCGARS